VIELQHNTAASYLWARVAPRFPLIPRARPACRALDARVAQVSDMTRALWPRSDDRLARAAEIHNVAALIVSDCGLSELARTLCWRQFATFRSGRPHGAGQVKLALQPVINVSRLSIREGDGDGAYRLLDTLFQTMKSRTTAVVDAHIIDLGDLIPPGDDHREVVAWLWTVLLSDGTRALTRAGRWGEALHHVQDHKGIGERLLDGRQVAVLAHCANRAYDTAATLLADTVVSAPWETAVAACLTVLRLRLAGQGSQFGTATMVNEYLTLKLGHEHAVFHTRLGLCVFDLAEETPGAPQIAEAVVHVALNAADAYAALDVLSHPGCHSRTTTDQEQALTDIVQASGLGSAAIPRGLLDDLMSVARVSEEAIRQALLSTHSIRRT
jgi:hypothetical protein